MHQSLATLCLVTCVAGHFGIKMKWNENFSSSIELPDSCSLFYPNTPHTQDKSFLLTAFRLQLLTLHCSTDSLKQQGIAVTGSFLPSSPFHARVRSEPPSRVDNHHIHRSDTPLEGKETVHGYIDWISQYKRTPPAIAFHTTTHSG